MAQASIKVEYVAQALLTCKPWQAVQHVTMYANCVYVWLSQGERPYLKPKRSSSLDLSAEGTSAMACLQAKTIDFIKEKHGKQ